MKSLSLSALLSTLYSQARRAAVWLPWLAAALLLAAALAPGTAVASRLAFQSPQSPLPPARATPVPAKPTPPPARQPTRPPASQPTQPPAEQPTQPPAEQPTQPPAGQPTQPPAGQPTQPPAPGQATPTPSPAAKATQSPAPSPTARPTRTPTPEPEAEGEATINWVKFWDTLVVWLAYPWMCCGVGLLLLVPLILLYLEISGRRRPPLPPEIPPEPADEEFLDEELNE